MPSMTHRELSRSTFSSSRPKIAEYVAIRPDAFHHYSYAHELTVTEAHTLTQLLLAVDRHTHTLETSITGLAEYVGLTRRGANEGNARRQMSRTLHRLINVGAITYEDSTVTVVVYNDLVRFGPKASTTPTVAESRAETTTSSGATISISEPETVSGRASARDPRAYTRDPRASAREGTGETPPTNELDTNPPTPQDDEVSIALAALHDRVGGQGKKRFTTNDRLRDAVQARLNDGWQPKELDDALTHKELDTAENVVAVLASRAERLGRPERTPHVPDWMPEPTTTNEDRERAKSGLAAARAALAPKIP